MGKLQIRRGAGAVPSLLPGEPFMAPDGLHVGKEDGTGAMKISETGASIKAKLEALEGDERLDASAIMNITGGSSAKIIEWVVGEAEPVINADIVVGTIEEGHKYVAFDAVISGQTLAYILPYEKYIEINYDFGDLLSVPRAVLQTESDIYVAIDSTVIKYNIDGTLNTGFAWVELDDDIYVLAEDAEGKLLVGGIFENALLRFNADGTEDVEFSSPNLQQYLTNDIDVRTILVDGSNIYVGGQFDGAVKKILPNGDIDTLFNAAITGYCASLAKLPDGSILCGTNDPGNGFLVKCDGGGNIDFDFVPDVDAPVESVIVANDAIYVGGYYTGFFRKLSLTGTNQNVVLQTAINAPVSTLALHGDTMLSAGLAGVLNHFNPDTGADVPFSVSDALSIYKVFSLPNKFAISVSGDPYLLITEANGDEVSGGQYVDDSLTASLPNMQSELAKATIFTDPEAGVYTITKAGVNVLPYNLIALQSFDIDFSDLNINDVIEIYNPADSLGIYPNINPINFEIGQELQANNYIKLVVVEVEGEKRVILVYSSMWIGQMT